MSGNFVTLSSETNTSPRSVKKSHVQVTDEWLYSRVNIDSGTTTTAINVTTVPAVLGKIRVETALSAHALPIYDGTTATTVLTLAASKSAETIVDMSGTIFNSDIRVKQSTTAQTGVILVQYRII